MKPLHSSSRHLLRLLPCKHTQLEKHTLGRRMSYNLPRRVRYGRQVRVMIPNSSWCDGAIMVTSITASGKSIPLCNWDGVKEGWRLAEAPGCSFEKWADRLEVLPICFPIEICGKHGGSDNLLTH
jgi:hypothetical protein